MKIKKKITYYPTGITEIMLFQNPINRQKKERGEKRHDTEKKSSDYYLWQSIKRARRKLKEALLSNVWELFVTFTFNPEKTDSLNYDVAKKKMSKWLNNAKQNHAPNLKYVIVAELHKVSKRIHFHAVLSNIGTLTLLDNDYVMTKEYKKPIKLKTAYKRNYIVLYKVYTLDSYKLGYTTCSYVQNDIKSSFYLLKYITKEMLEKAKGKKSYWLSYNLNKPLVIYKDWGLNNKEYKSGFYDMISLYKREYVVESDLYNQKIMHYIIENKYIDIPQSVIDCYNIFGKVVKVVSV